MLIVPEDEKSEVVGFYFKNYAEMPGRSNLYYCDSYDKRIGYWMTSDNRRTNVSERAIGRTFHKQYDGFDSVQPMPPVDYDTIVLKRYTEYFRPGQRICRKPDCTNGPETAVVQSVVMLGIHRDTFIKTTNDEYIDPHNYEFSLS